MNAIYTINGKGKLVEFIKSNGSLIDGLLKKEGAILFRDFKIHSSLEFQKVSQLICNELFDYKYGSTPRTKIAGKIYTSTEYPNTQRIPLHNENSYTNKWPSKILFFCAIEPKIGGETPIANAHDVYNDINVDIKEKFITKKVMYLRNYGFGLDLSWQQAFQTDSKEEVEHFCNENEIEFEWLDRDKLRTKQVCQSVVKHPIHGYDVWFNQAHLFHESANDPELKEYFRTNPSVTLPRNAFFGDGEELDVISLDMIRSVYKHNEKIFKWKKGDLMVLDNLLYCHGRNPFEGERRILVSMGD